jgi:enoyl-CoA hydratase
MENKHIVTFEIIGNIAIVTFNRPESMNALSSQVNRRLVELLDMAEIDEKVKVIVLTGAGEKAFVAGGDIKEMLELDAMGARAYALQAKRAVDKIYNLSKPVIAAINGFCLGGGLEYAMACDFRVASENAKFGLPEINIGIMPGSSGTQRLPRVIGMGMAKELIMTGSLFDAKTALDMGVINHLFPTMTLMDETIKIAKQIASKSSVALSLIKSAMNRGAEVDLETGFQFEMDCFGLCFTTEEQNQAMKAFVKK